MNLNEVLEILNILRQGGAGLSQVQVVTDDGDLLPLKTIQVYHGIITIGVDCADLG